MTAGKRWQSIERKLPLLFSTVLLGTVALFTWAAYGRVQRVLIASAGTRVQSASSVAALLLGQAMARYRAQLADVVADPAVVGYLTTGHRADAAQALTLAWVGENIPRGRLTLRSVNGSVLIDTARGNAPATTPWTAHMLASGSVQPGVALIGPLYRFGDSIYTESVAAVAVHAPTHPRGADSARADSAVVGYVTDLRFVASPSAAAIRNLIGGGATVLIGSPEQGTWSDLEHTAAPPPAGVAAGSTLVFGASARGAGVGAAVTIPGTPWLLWVEQPRAVILAPMHRLLWQLAVLASVLVVAGAVGAWLLSRRMTAPLVSLTVAAEQLAADPSPIPASHRTEDEIARLTDAFQRMAARVTESLALAEGARTEAEASNHAKGAFLATISHELRTPLNAITGYAALLQDGVRGALSADQAEDIGRIRKAAHHLLGLINDLLNFAKLESGEVKLTIADVVIPRVLSEAVTMVEPQARSKGLTLAYHASSADACARGDREKVLQIILNLLSNAIKFTRSGGRIALDVVVSDREVQTTVSDTGRGIPSEEVHRVFEPFVQVGRQLATPGEGGVGLGLAISRELARVMSGDLTVRSVLREGSTFTLTLPRAMAPAGGGPQSADVARAPAGAG